MTNEIEKFNEQALSVMENIAHFAKKKSEIEAKDKALRDELLKLCEEYGVQSVDNQFVKISYVKGSESVSVDLKKMENAEPDLYAELIEDYPKKTVRKPYMRIVAKV